jgi:hypothetical protein
MSDLPVSQADSQPRMPRSSRRALIVLLLLSAFVFCLAYQVPATVRLDVGGAGDSRFLQGFYFGERQDSTTFRWSGPLAIVRFAGVGGRAWTVRMRASGLRPVGPAEVRVTANGLPVADQALGGEMAEYAFSIGRPFSGMWGNLDLGLAVEPFVAPPDERKLGVMVDWVELSPAGSGVTAPPWGTLVALLVVVALCYLSAERLLRRRLGASASPRWALLVGLLVAAGLGAGVAWARLWIGINVPWLVLASGLLWLASRRIGQAPWWEWLLFALLAWSAVAFMSRALTFFRDGLPPGDFMIYFDAANNVRLGKPLYDFAAAVGIPLGPVYKYPPVFAVLMAPATALPARSVAAWWYLLNLVLLGLAGYGLARGLRAPERPDLDAAGAYIIAIGFLNFRPAWESLIRGQLDPMILAAAVGALLLLEARRMEWLAGVLIGLVTMVKLYPGLFALYLLWQRRWRALAGFAVTVIALVVVSGVAIGWHVLWRYVTEILVVQTVAVPWPEDQSFDGFLSRLIIPTAATTWYSAFPFPAWAKMALYLADLAIFGLTAWVLWRGARNDRFRFRLGYAAIMPLIVLMWPLSWIHYQTLLLLPFAVIALDQLQRRRRSWPLIAGLAVSFLLTAIGNEYLVLTPALNRDGWVRLLQSYKFFGVLLLWGLLLWSRRDDNA